MLLPSFRQLGSRYVKVGSQLFYTVAQLHVHALCFCLRLWYGPAPSSRVRQSVRQVNYLSLKLLDQFSSHLGVACSSQYAQFMLECKNKITVRFAAFSFSLTLNRLYGTENFKILLLVQWLGFCSQKFYRLLMVVPVNKKIFGFLKLCPWPQLIINIKQIVFTRHWMENSKVSIISSEGSSQSETWTFGC